MMVKVNNMEVALKSIPSKFHKDIPLLIESASKAKNSLINDLQAREKSKRNLLKLEILSELSDIDIVKFVLTCEKDLVALQLNGRVDKPTQLKARIANYEPLATDLAMVKGAGAVRVLDRPILFNQIVYMRHNVKQAKVQVINKLVKVVKKLSKGDSKKIEKYNEKVKKLIKQIKYIKKFEADDVSRFALSTKEDLHKVVQNVNTPLKLTAMAKLALNRCIAKPVEEFKNKYPNWKKEVPLLLHKKKTKSTLKKELKVGNSKTKPMEVEGESENESGVEVGSDENESEMEGDCQEEASDEEEDSNANSDVEERSDEENESSDNEESEIEGESYVDKESDEDDSNVNEESEIEEESESEEKNDEEESNEEEDSEESNEEEDSEESQSEEESNEIENEEKTSSSEDEQIERKKSQSKKGVLNGKRVKNMPNPPSKKMKTVEKQIKKVPKKTTINNGKNKQLKTVKKSSKKQISGMNAPKVVDPFFMTTNDKEYITSQVPVDVDDTKSSWKSNNNNFNKKPSKTFNKFIGKSKWTTQENNGKGKKFTGSKLFPNNLQSDSKSNSKPLIDFRNRKERRQALQKTPEKPVEKLHPSWEAKKKQSSITTFQGKKVVFG